MTNYLLKSLPPQSVKIYRLLINSPELTAKDVGYKLQILPNAVYRATKPLLELSFIEQTENYPLRYKVKHTSEALDLYSLIIRQNFEEEFELKNTISNTAFKMSFIQDRDYLLENTNKDVSSSKNTVKFIVSGLEVSGETMLVYKRAIERGVEIKAIVQKVDAKAYDMFKNWIKIGLQVRYLPNIESRIFVIDKRIVYFTSYNKDRKNEAIGVRFNYPPYAKLMDELFEQKWKKALKISVN